MKTYHTASSLDGLRLPHSGVLIGTLAEALRLKVILREDWPGASDTSYRTIQNYFAGERVDGRTVESALNTMIDRLVPDDILLPQEAGESLKLHTVICGAVGHWVARWERLVAVLNASGYPVKEERDLPIPVLRLVVLDAGLRWGALAAIRHFTQGIVPDWDAHWLSPGALRRLIDGARQGRTVWDFAEASGVTARALEAWRTTPTLPRGANLEELAVALVQTMASTDPTRLSVGLRLRVVVALQDLRERLTEVCGPDRIDDLVTGLVLTARLVHDRWYALLAGEGALPLDLDARAFARDLLETFRTNFVPRLWNVVVYGAHCPTGEMVCREMAEAARHKPEVAFDFMSLPGDWVGRIRYWMDALGSTSHQAAFLEARHGPGLGPLSMTGQRFVTLATAAMLRMAEYDRQAGVGWEAMILNAPPEVRAFRLGGLAQQAASVPDFALAAEYARHAAELQPLDAAHHWSFGCYLWQSSRDPEVWERALLECRLAVELDPDFGNARNEIAIILGNLGRFDEAEAAFAEAEPFHGGHAHHWFCRGNNYLCLKRYPQAAAAFQKAIDLTKNGEHVEAKYRLAAVMMAAGRKQEARRLGRRVEHLLGVDPSQHWQALLDPKVFIGPQDAGSFPGR